VLTGRDDDGVVLEAATGWSGARGNVARVTIELEASPAVAARRWRSGAYDVLDDQLAVRIVADEETVIQGSPGMGTWYLGLDARRAPLDDALVRRAFAHAIDRRRQAEFFGVPAAETGGLLPPAIPGHSNRVAPRFDPHRAQALLREAGYADGRDLGEIVLLGLDLWKEATSDVAAQLGRIGVRVRVHLAASDPEGLTAIDEGAVHAYLWGWMADSPDPGGGFLDPMLTEWPVYRDKQLEGLLARAASLRDQDERLRTYREFERIWIGEQAAVVPLAYGDRLLWRRPWVEGMWANGITWSTFADAVVTRHDRPGEAGAGAVEQADAV
jgi:ABC-type transport system substrate-binding protein